jgi:hypothetical protein
MNSKETANHILKYHPTYDNAIGDLMEYLEDQWCLTKEGKEVYKEIREYIYNYELEENSFIYLKRNKCLDIQ